MSPAGMQKLFFIYRGWMVAKSLVVLTAVLFMSTSIFLFMFSTSEVNAKDRLHRILFCLDQEVASF